MNNYLESIKSTEDSGTGVNNQIELESTVILDINENAPSDTYAEYPIYEEECGRDVPSYAAPKKVIVRTYRLRK